MDKKSVSIQAPLPKVEREKLERKAVYEHSKKDITKWEPLVKMNREAPTIIFDEDTNLGFSTVGAIASGFEPRTEFEKKMASLVNDEKVAEAHKEDGARLLEMNKVCWSYALVIYLTIYYNLMKKYRICLGVFFNKLTFWNCYYNVAKFLCH